MAKQNLGSEGDRHCVLKVMLEGAQISDDEPNFNKLYTIYRRDLFLMPQQVILHVHVAEQLHFLCPRILLPPPSNP